MGTTEHSPHVIEAYRAQLSLNAAADYLGQLGLNGISPYCSYAILTPPQAEGSPPTVELYLTVPDASVAGQINPNGDRYTEITPYFRANTSSTPSLDPTRHTPGDALRSIGAAINTIGLPVRAAGGMHLNSLPPHDTAMWADAACHAVDVERYRDLLLQRHHALPNLTVAGVYNLPLLGLWRPGQSFEFMLQYGLNTDRAHDMRPSATDWPQ